MSRHFTQNTPEWWHLRRRVNLEILDETHTITPTDIPIHLAKQSAQYLLWLLEDDHANQRDEFEMARNALLPIPDIKRRWLTMPYVWEKRGLPDMTDEEARGFVVDGIWESIECRRDTAEVAKRTWEWRRRWREIEPSHDRVADGKAEMLTREWPYPC